MKTLDEWLRQSKQAFATCDVVVMMA